MKSRLLVVYSFGEIYAREISKNMIGYYWIMRTQYATRPIHPPHNLNITGIRPVLANAILATERDPRLRNVLYVPSAPNLLLSAAHFYDSDRNSGVCALALGM